MAYYLTVRDSSQTLHSLRTTFWCDTRFRSYLCLVWLQKKTKSHIHGRIRLTLLPLRTNWTPQVQISSVLLYNHHSHVLLGRSFVQHILATGTDVDFYHKNKNIHHNYDTFYIYFALSLVTRYPRRRRCSGSLQFSFLRRRLISWFAGRRKS